MECGRYAHVFALTFVISLRVRWSLTFFIAKDVGAGRGSGLLVSPFVFSASLRVGGVLKGTGSSCWLGRSVAVAATVGGEPDTGLKAIIGEIAILTT